MRAVPVPGRWISSALNSNPLPQTTATYFEIPPKSNDFDPHHTGSLLSLPRHLLGDIKPNCTYGDSPRRLLMLSVPKTAHYPMAPSRHKISEITLVRLCNGVGPSASSLPILPLLSSSVYRWSNAPHNAVLAVPVTSCLRLAHVL